MTDVIERQQQAENVKAFKDGVASGAPANTRYNFVEGTRPAGKDDIAHIGVEMHTENSGLSIDASKSIGVKTPVGDLSLKQLFAKMAGVSPDSLKMAPPGNVATYYQEIGEHESPHLAHHPGGLDGGLGNEIGGDRGMYNGNNPAEEEALRDTRKLSSLTHPDHATSPALPDKPGGTVAEEKNTIKLYAAAKDFGKLVSDDLIKQGKIASAGELEALQKKDPKAVYDSVQKLKQDGTFDNIDGSRGEFIRQYATDYTNTAEKWIKGIEPAVDQKATPALTNAAPPAQKGGSMADALSNITGDNYTSATKPVTPTATEQTQTVGPATPKVQQQATQP